MVAVRNWWETNEVYIQSSFKVYLNEHEIIILSKQKDFPMQACTYSNTCPLHKGYHLC